MKNNLKEKNVSRKNQFKVKNNFLIPISLQPNVVDLRYFKL